MASEFKFCIRAATPSPEDANFFVAAFDSSQRHLEELGNSGQWGVNPYSQKAGIIEETRDDLAASEHFRITGKGSALRTFIAEIEDPGKVPNDGPFRRLDDEGKTMISVGAITVRIDNMPSHVSQLKSLESFGTETKRRGDYIFIDLLISDFRAGDARRGSGIALLNHIKQYAQETKKKSLLVDCYAGGMNKLADYYGKQGYKRVASFEIPKKDGSVWPGIVMRLDLQPEI